MAQLKITNQNKYFLPQTNRKQIVFNNFLGGFSWSIGAFLGIAVIGVTVGILASKINLVPIIGGWFGEVLNHATQNLRTPIQQ